MRELADATRVRELMGALGRATKEDASIYFTGGATAVLYGWRGITVDVDLRMEPEHDELLRAIAALKDRLSINVELASPEDFVPVAPDWRARSPFIERIGPISYHHFDLHAQALSKAERSHRQDLADVRAMLDRELITAESMWRYYDRVSPNLHRYPAVAPEGLKKSLVSVFGHRPEMEDDPPSRGRGPTG